MKKKLVTYALAGALSLGVIGGTVVPAFAAAKQDSAKTTVMKQRFHGMNQNIDEATKAKIQAIMDDARAQLKELGVTLPEKPQKQEFFANLDEATKAKVQAIRDQEKVGTITREEARKQIAALGIELPEKQGPFANLDEATKAKVQAIMDQEKAGTITREEAHTQIAALGIELPEKQGPFANLDEATKAKAKAIMDEAQAKIKDLGVEMPAKGMGHIKFNVK